MLNNANTKITTKGNRTFNKLLYTLSFLIKKNKLRTNSTTNFSSTSTLELKKYNNVKSKIAKYLSFDNFMLINFSNLINLY